MYLLSGARLAVNNTTLSMPPFLPELRDQGRRHRQVHR